MDEVNSLRCPGNNVREIDFDDCSLKIKEFTFLQDEAGAVVWDAGLVLSFYLAYQQGSRGHPVVAGRTCLDLGCGTGVVGLTAARLGAAQVYLSDLPHLVPYVRENIQLNGLGDVCHAMTLEWGNPEHMVAAKSSLLMRAPDVVLAADVVYTATARQSLFRTLADIMTPASSGSDARPNASAPGAAAPADIGRGERADEGSGGGSVAYLSYEQRPGVEELPELCRRHGLAAEEIAEEEMHPTWRSPDIHILRLRKQPCGASGSERLERMH